VDNIVSEPSGTGLNFILHGTTDVGSNPVIYGISFSGVQPRTCVDDDYESWTFMDGRSTAKCQLGRNVTYSRRIQSANCYNERAIEHILSNYDCPCSFEDYECDFGYEETFTNGQLYCVISTKNPPEDPPKGCVPGQTYEVSQGFRIIAGDSCVGQLPEYTPNVKVCPHSDEGTKRHTVVIVIVILLIVVIFGGFAFLLYKNESWRVKLFSLVGIRSGANSRYSRLGGRHGALAEEEFGIGGEHDLDDSDVEEDAPVLQDNDILQATAEKRGESEFDPRT